MPPVNQAAAGSATRISPRAPWKRRLLLFLPAAERSISAPSPIPESLLIDASEETGRRKPHNVTAAGARNILTAAPNCPPGWWGKGGGEGCPIKIETFSGGAAAAVGGNTDAASRRLCFSRFCLFPAHRLCRDVGFIIVRSKHEVLGASPPTLSRGNKRTDEPQDKWLRPPRMT